MRLADLAEVLEAAARRARELDAEARAERRDWCDQTMSPLGRRRHVAAVRRRVATGEAGAAMLGRRALLSLDAITEELSRASSRPGQSKLPDGTAARIQARIALVRGAR